MTQEKLPHRKELCLQSEIGFAYSAPLPLDLEGWGFLLVTFPS